jgi:acetyltransferase-like isoleucine patch superfamily enzyme
MGRFDRFVLAAKRGESPMGRLARDTYRRLLAFDLPETEISRFMYGTSLNAYSVGVEAMEWVGAKFLYAPMLRARAARAGKHLYVSSAPYIRGHARIEIGDDCTFSFLAVKSGRFVDEPVLTFGDRCYIAHGVQFAVNQRITLGNDVMIAANSVVRDSDDHPSDAERRARHDALSLDEISPVTIHDSAWIGRGAQILKGVTLGRGAIVAAGSVVVSDVPDGAIAMGIPARVLKAK